MKITKKYPLAIRISVLKNPLAYIAENNDITFMSKNGKNLHDHNILCFAKMFHTLFCDFRLTYPVRLL